MQTGLRVHGSWTKKLLDRLKVPLSPPASEPLTALGNWYATLLWRPQVAMFVNERPFLPVFVLLAPSVTLVRRFPAQLAEALARFGIDPRFVAGSEGLSDDRGIGRENCGSLLGVMNELAFQADVRISHGFDAVDLVTMSVGVAHVLLTPLFKDRDGHGSPDRTLLALVAELTL